MEKQASTMPDRGADLSGAAPGAVAIAGLERLEPIGRGGFGVVYRGHQPELARDVAVKVVTSPAADGSALERWRNEISAMGRLSNHPNIVTVYSGGLTEAGLPYLVMPFVPGGSLHDRLTNEGPLPAADVASLGSKLAAALAAAHEVGVLHRDVKPDNVLLSPYGEPQLTDFGIARLLDATTTAAGTVHATIRYAAPEVLSGQPATEASDVYGLGATLYACLTGAAPFADASDESIVALVGRIATQDPVDLSSLGVPDELARTIHSALAKSPSDRIASADEMHQKLDAAAASLNTPAAGASGRTTVATRPQIAPAPDHERTAAVPVVTIEQARHLDAAVTVAAPHEPRTLSAPSQPTASRPERRTVSGRRRSWGPLAALGVLVIGLAALLLVVNRDDGRRAGTNATVPPSAAAPRADAEATPTTTPRQTEIAEALAGRATAYFDAIRAGRLDASYGMLSPEFRRGQAFSDYESYWRGRTVTIHGPVSVDEGARAATVPLTVDGKREDFRLTFTRASDGTWYVDGPRPG
ncbi:MAG TPA: protein kinase [Acidimicrobiales bacterium]|nr:protein kinase [Acidimicrobiales bacterium]